MDILVRENRNLKTENQSCFQIEAELWTKIEFKTKKENNNSVEIQIQFLF